MEDRALISGKRNAINNWLRKFSTEILPRERKYRLKENFLGLFKWCKEFPLPRVDYVLVFKHVFAKCEACSIDERENNLHAYFQVSLVHHKNRRIVVHETKSKDEALNLGTKLATELSTRLRDATVSKQEE